MQAAEEVLPVDGLYVFLENFANPKRQVKIVSNRNFLSELEPKFSGWHTATRNLAATAQLETVSILLHTGKSDSTSRGPQRPQ
jgi:hypothetical protein